MIDSDLHNRLEALAKKIATHQAHLDQNRMLFKQHQHLTGRRLEERYRILRQKLEREVADAEAQGHHVSKLEKSVRAWIDGIDMDT